MTSAAATVQNGARTRGAGALNHVSIPTVRKEDGTKSCLWKGKQKYGGLQNNSTWEILLETSHKCINK